MKKLKKILRLSDPYPNLWYEFFCYVKAALGTSFLILGLFLIFLRQLADGFLIWGIISVLAGLFFFWRIKLVRKLVGK
jgi:hypothetical protein